MLSHTHTVTALDEGQDLGWVRGTPLPTNLDCWVWSNGRYAPSSVLDRVGWMPALLEGWETGIPWRGPSPSPHRGPLGFTKGAPSQTDKQTNNLSCTISFSTFFRFRKEKLTTFNWCRKMFLHRQTDSLILTRWENPHLSAPISSAESALLMEV